MCIILASPEIFTPVKEPIYLLNLSLKPNVAKYKLVNKENALLPDQECDIVIENKQLLIKGAGMPNFHFLPETQSSFFSKETEATVKFFKNQKGVVDKMFVSHAGSTLVAVRVSL